MRGILAMMPFTYSIAKRHLDQQRTAQRRPQNPLREKGGDALDYVGDRNSGTGSLYVLGWRAIDRRDVSTKAGEGLFFTVEK